jgi:hypothetical protein
VESTGTPTPENARENGRFPIRHPIADFTALGEAWRYWNYLWTRRALRIFEPRFKGT